MRSSPCEDFARELRCVPDVSRPEGSAPARKLPTNRRACRRRSWSRCGPRSDASCSWLRRARSRSARRDRAIRESSSIPYGGSVISRSGLASPSSRATTSGCVQSPQMTRWSPRTNRSPSLATGSGWTSGTASSSVRPGAASCASSSRWSSMSVEPNEIEVVVLLVENRQFDAKHFFVPAGALDAPVGCRRSRERAAGLATGGAAR